MGGGQGRGVGGLTSVLLLSGVGPRLAHHIIGVLVSGDVAVVVLLLMFLLMMLSVLIGFAAVATGGVVGSEDLGQECHHGKLRTRVTTGGGRTGALE